MLVKAMQKASDAYRFVSTYGQHLPLAWDAVFKFRCTVRLLRGAPAGGGEPVTLLYAGRDRNYACVTRMAFDDFAVLRCETATLFSVRGLVARMAGEADVVIVDVGWPYHGTFNRRREYAEVPDWVNMVVELPETWDAVLANFRRTARKHDLRLIRRNAYRCRPSRDPAAVERFYDRMYLPYVRHRHSSESAIAPRKHVLKRGRGGTLLEILRGEETVAAGLVYPEGEVLYSLWLGLAPAHLESPPEAAISALYYFGIRHAFDQGFRYFDFAGTRAFLDDGPYQFKRRWGAVLEDEFSPSSILIRPANGSDAIRFCARFPVLRRTGSGLEALFVNPDGNTDAEYFRRLEKSHGCAGIERMIVIEVAEEEETQILPAGAGGCEYRILRCSSQHFTRCYTSRQ